MKKEESSRIKIALNYLKLKGLVKSQKEMAEKMGFSESSTSSAINGNEKYLTPNFIQRFNEAFGNIFRLEWLIDGVGDMLCCNIQDSTVRMDPLDIELIGAGRDNHGTITQSVGCTGNPVELAALQKENEMLREQAKRDRDEIEFLRSLIKK